MTINSPRRDFPAIS